MSNAKKGGVWLFHIGRPFGSEGNVMPADLDSSGGSEDRQDEHSRATCADTLLPCPPHSTCVDLTDRHGFCCTCRDGYFGNGQNCVEKSKFKMLLCVTLKKYSTNEIFQKNLTIQSI